MQTVRSSAPASQLMKRYWSLKRALLVSVCAAAACGGIAADHPRRAIPVDGTCGNTFELTSTATPGVFHNSIEGAGNIPNLGLCTVVIDETVDFRTAPATGNQHWILTFAGGDQLTASLYGTGAFDQTDPAFITGALQGAITGGTGRFQDATGEVRGPFAAHIDTALGAFPAGGHSTIALGGWVRLKGN
jgi:hypothetical protein